MVNFFSWARLMVFAFIFICLCAVLLALNGIGGIFIGSPCRVLQGQIDSASAVTMLSAEQLSAVFNFCFSTPQEPQPLTPELKLDALQLIGRAAFINCACVFIGLLPLLLGLAWVSVSAASIFKRHYVFELKNPLNLLTACAWIRGFSLLALFWAAFMPAPSSPFIAAAAFSALSVSHLFIFAFRRCAPY